MERLKHIKERLITALETQMEDLENADAQEMGEVMDMIKDVEEAIYYCTITDSMKNKHISPEEVIK